MKQDGQTAQPGQGDAPGPGQVFRRLAAMVDNGEEGVLATVVATRDSAPRHAGSKMIIHADGSLTGTIGGGSAEALVIEAAADVLAGGECRTVPIDLAGEHGVCGGSMEIFLEPVQRAVPFLIVGAGHVGQAVARLGQTLPFRFTLLDDRPAMLAQAAALPGVRTVLATPQDLADQARVPPRGAVLVCSRNHELDAGYLEALLRVQLRDQREYTFFGSLGSQAKAARLRAVLRKQAELVEPLTRVRLPVGIDLGAETPAEIGLSVLAEALAVLRGVVPVAGPAGTSAYPVLGPGK